MFLDITILRAGLHAFGSMLLHSLWQGVFVWLIAGVILRIGRHWRAVLRYNTLLVLFSAFLLSTTITFFIEWNGFFHEASANINDTSPIQTHLHLGWQLNYIQTYLRATVSFLRDQQQLFFSIWAFIFLYKAANIITALLYQQRLKSSPSSVTDMHWQQWLQDNCQRLRISRRVQLLESAAIKTPVVFSHLKPVILLPLGFMLQLKPDEMEAILLHELAHIRRNDYLVNMLQRLSEAIFFFNPGILRVSAWLQEEREFCCDASVYSIEDKKSSLISALITCKEMEIKRSTALMFVPAESQLMSRIKRIAGQPAPHIALSGKRWAFAALVVFVLLSLAAGQTKFTSSVNTNSNAHALSVKPAAASIEPRSVVAIRPTSATAEVNGVAKNVVAAARNRSRRQRTYLHTPENQDQQSIAATPSLEMQLKLQAEKSQRDLQQADEDRQQADADLEQAQRDQQMAMINQQKAQKDQELAMINQRLALEDQQRAKKEQERLRLDRVKSQNP